MKCIECNGHESSILALLAQCGKISKKCERSDLVRLMLSELPDGPKRKVGECLVGWRKKASPLVWRVVKGLRRWANSLGNRASRS